VPGYHRAVPPGQGRQTAINLAPTGLHPGLRSVPTSWQGSTQDAPSLRGQQPAATSRSIETATTPIGTKPSFSKYFLLSLFPRMIRDQPPISEKRGPKEP
jgi:hypothetical protein